MKKVCAKCFREYTEDDDGPSPADVLGQIFIETVGDQDAGDTCPTCREDLGIRNLLGFGGGDDDDSKGRIENVDG